MSWSYNEHQACDSRKDIELKVHKVTSVGTPWHGSENMMERWKVNTSQINKANHENKTKELDVDITEEIKWRATGKIKKQHYI
jgi:hypothetical protein